MAEIQVRRQCGVSAVRHWGSMTAALVRRWYRCDNNVMVDKDKA